MSSTEFSDSSILLSGSIESSSLGHVLGSSEFGYDVESDVDVGCETSQHNRTVVKIVPVLITLLFFSLVALAAIIFFYHNTGNVEIARFRVFKFTDFKDCSIEAMKRCVFCGGKKRCFTSSEHEIEIPVKKGLMGFISPPLKQVSPKRSKIVDGWNNFEIYYRPEHTSYFDVYEGQFNESMYDDINPVFPDVERNYDCHVECKAVAGEEGYPTGGKDGVVQGKGVRDAHLWCWYFGIEACYPDMPMEAEAELIRDGKNDADLPEDYGWDKYYYEDPPVVIPWETDLDREYEERLKKEGTIDDIEGLEDWDDDYTNIPRYGPEGPPWLRDEKKDDGLEEDWYEK